MQRALLPALVAALLVGVPTTQAARERDKHALPGCGVPLDEAVDPALVAARRRMSEHWPLPPGWMHSVVRGAAHARTVVLFHGLHNDSKNFQRTSNVLAKHYRVVAVDLRGHGLTPALGWNYSSTTLARDVKEHLDSLTPKAEGSCGKVHLLGHSFGGKVALRFAQLYPECTRSLVVEDMGFRPLEEAKFQDERELGWGIAIHRVLREPLTAALDVRPEAVGPSQLEQWRLVLGADFVPALFTTQIRGEQFDEALSSLHVPALFLRPGETARAVLNNLQIRHLRHFRPDARIIEIPRAEHDIHTSKPVLFESAVLEFFGQVDGAFR